MPQLDRDGVTIYYEITAASDPGRGRLPILLTHGYSATAEMWAANLSALARDQMVITWDMRGHGRSDSPRDPDLYSEALSVGDMAAVLDAAGAGRAVVGGLSLGGYLSLAFHLVFPARVAALVLCDTGPGYRRDDTRAGWNAMAEQTATRFEQRGLDALGSSAEVAASHHRSAEGLALAARGMLAQRNGRVLESLPSIAVPTLVLVGAEDKPFLTAADVMAAKIPGATKAVLPGAGHAANIDQPAAFDQAVLDFLDQIPT
jgi:pimeloyl-ACP methyl ester carboxylesterase